MAHSLPNKSTSAKPNPFASRDSLRGMPSDTPTPKRQAEEPVGGRLSKSCGIHDDGGPLPPLRR
jgi:hypothetical protein